ncbi:serine hydrolase [Rhizobium sp. BK060]|uniref:serine hydrolase domain-containing protein n=1 Tax=Rhizobium sp. BK060 TaxID=2587096 RepID=UPI00162045C5|nr:serine hydrolase [Rhizobium sp. BK060]MBB3397653.1 CubicO group peptidase (beta-lactamase class C family) [Rhizobium sp. BK060]
MAEVAFIYPDSEWRQRTEGGWDAAVLENLVRELERGGSTAMMIIDGGRLAFSWGDTAYKSSIASVRKSLISMLFGIHAEAGRIDLSATLADLGIIDVAPLTAEERTATVRNLLAARSGVYLPSVYDTKRGRPERGNHPPGSFWFYNNWDFNVLGTILEAQTGENLFESFAARIAAPLGMQDFSPDDCRYQHGPESLHPVYKMAMSARDFARVGLLYLRGGRWNGVQVVPEDWVRLSTQPHSDLGGGRGYGYLWLTAEANAPKDLLSIQTPLFYASGFGGQYIIVVPALELVVVHRAARVDYGISHIRMGELMRLAISARSNR